MVRAARTAGGSRRSTLAVACITGLLATSTVLAGCGGSDGTSDAGETLTAVLVGQRLKNAGAPIMRPVRDTTFESRWTDYQGLATDAETATRSLELTIEVYDTAANRKWASSQQDANLAASAQYSTVKAECGVILVSGVGGKGPAQAAARRREFGKVEKALRASFGPC